MSGFPQRALQDPAKLDTKLRVRSNYIAAVQRFALTVNVGAHAAGFLDDDHAGRDIPRRQIELPEAVQTPGGHVGQIE